MYKHLFITNLKIAI